MHGFKVFDTSPLGVSAKTKGQSDTSAFFFLRETR